MSLRLFVIPILLLLTAVPAAAQDTGASLLAAARKRAQDATGRKGPELEAVLEDAIRLYGLVPDKFPDDGPSVARAWLEIGRAERRLGRSAGAEAAFRKASARPEEARTACDALHDLATLHRKAKKSEEARAALRQVIDGFPGQAASRAQALVRLAGLHRDAREYPQAEECLRRCLVEHADAWRTSIEALDDLVALKLRVKEPAEARRLLDTHGEAIKARFAGTSQEERVERALEKMPSRARLDRESGAAGGTEDAAPARSKAEEDRPAGKSSGAIRK